MPQLRRPEAGTYAAWVWLALAFLAQPPAQRRRLLPDCWPQPREPDNGYAFLAEQPAHVMQDFCESWLQLPELWREDVEFTALALATADVQEEVQQHLRILRDEAVTRGWQRWRDGAASSKRARAVLQVMQWPTLLTQAELCAGLNAETYGTFGAAFSAES